MLGRAFVGKVALTLGIEPSPPVGCSAALLALLGCFRPEAALQLASAALLLLVAHCPSVLQAIELSE